MKVDFYILDETNEEKGLRFACQQTEEAYHHQKQIYLHVNSYETAERLDQLLWTFRDDSFLPHQILSVNSSNIPIQIGYQNEAIPPLQDIFINLSNTIPPFYRQFNHLIEVVFSDPTVQQLARERYRQYREQSFELNTYKLK